MSRNFYYTRKRFQDQTAVEKYLQANLERVEKGLQEKKYVASNGLIVSVKTAERPWRLNLFWRCQEESRDISQLSGDIYQFLMDFIRAYDNFFLHFSPMQSDPKVLIFEFRVDDYNKFMLLHSEDDDQDLYYPTVTR